MKPFEKCPVCGGELVPYRSFSCSFYKKMICERHLSRSSGLETKQVEKLLRGGGNTVSMKVTAEACLRCGERLYAEDVVKSFEEIRGKLRRQEFSHLKSLGQSFTVEENWPNKAIQPTA